METRDLARQRQARVYDHRLVRRLWFYVKPHWRPLLASLTLLPLGAALQLAPPYILKLAIDRAIVPAEFAKLPPLALLLVGILLAQYLTNFGHILLLQICGQRAMHDLRTSAHRHLLSLRASFFDRTPVGTVMTRVTNDVESISEAFAAGLVAVLGDVIKLLGIVVIMLWLDARLAALTFCVLPPLLLVVIVSQRLLRQAHRQIRRRLARISGTLQEQITGMKVVQVFGREARSQHDFDQVNRSYRDAYRGAIRYDAILYSVVELLGSLTVALLLWYGGVHVVSEAVTFGLLVAFIEYVERFFEPIRDISTKYTVMQQAMAASERVFELLDTDEPDGVPPKGSGSLALTKSAASDTDAAVTFDNVTFGYNSGPPLFDGLSFSVPRGTSLAIVGATGSGKTTLVRLLTRLYEIQGGRILLGGTGVDDLSLSELRRRVVVLSQDVFLFGGTIRSNISLGDASVSDAAVDTAAERVGLTGLLSLDQIVGERGNNLSTGERQLVVFARALARDPDLLVLDEATASVDPESERLVQHGVTELMKGRTAIVIAHRLTTIEQVDQVLVLHRGRIAEQGTHRQLLQQDGIYSRLHRLQYVD